MKSRRKAVKKIGAAAAAVLLIWLASPLSGEEAPGFLKGKVQLLDRANLTLAQKFESAEKEFKKTKSGGAYFTVYTFLSWHEFHTGGEWNSKQPYRATIKNGEIKLLRASEWMKKSGQAAGAKEGGEPVGILFLHSLSGNKAEIVDAQIIDLDHSYEFDEEPAYWLGAEDTGESIQFLEGLFEGGRYGLQKTLVFVISSHNSPKAYDFLRRVTLGDYAKECKRDAVFWLGNYRDEKSLGYLKEIYKKEKDAGLKERVVFAFQLSDRKEAVEELINIAKNEGSQEVRKKAIFWLGQKASKESLKALKDVVEGSEDTDVKNQAVFAISRLPKEKSVPMLIEIARTNKNSAVRKRAIFWLGQKDSDEALKFFEEILLQK